jgi:hypothetical protein
MRREFIDGRMHLHHIAHRARLIAGAGVVSFLAACSAQDSASVGTTDTIALSPTASVAAVVDGGRQTVSLSFDATGTTTLTDFTVTSGLAPLPAGWSGPSTFACASVSTGSGCLLNLAYAPSAVGAGTITLAYSYKDSAGTTHTGTATVNYTGTTNNNVLGTAAPAGQITATVGQGAQAVAVTFTTDDGNPATALTLTTDLATLPAGWTSTAKSFTCATLATGNGCQLPLTYAPPALASGTLTLNYSYKDNSGDAKTGTVALSYVGTEFDNVVGTVAPSGQVVAVVGAGTQAVAVTFTTDDGHQATALLLTSGLAALPPGWSSTASSFRCATVSTGNGCQLPLSFTPTAAGSGTIALTYSYTDVGGHAKTGTVNIPYAGTTNNNVVGNTSPTGQVNAVVGAGAQTVVISFDTDDGNPASGFAVTTNLNTLPAGWHSSVSHLTCTQTSTGSTCQLTLTYTPTADASGTLSIGFAYTDNAGTAKTGTVGIPYTATEHDNVLGTTSPAGQVSDVIGNAPQPVTVTFTTDDGNPAHALSITSGLSSLPLGWSSNASSFTCATASTGTGCQLHLTFTPTATATGTLAFGYAYTDNAGSPKTGTVTIHYVSTSHNTILGTPNPAGTVRVKVGLSEPIAVTFTTNDGNTATDFQITSDLTALPGGWSGTNGFTCSTVNSGAGCSITLTYAPVTNATGNVTLDFSYIDSASTPQTGSAMLAYSNPHLYVFDYSYGISLCAINLDGTLSSCTGTATGLFDSYGGGTFTATNGYVPDYFNQKIYVCTLDPPGTLSNCADSGAALGGDPQFLANNGSFLYAGVTGSKVVSCAIGAAGALSNCSTAATVSDAYGVTVSGSHLYVSTFGSGTTLCTIASDGSLSNCALTGGATMTDAAHLVVSGGFSYAAVSDAPYSAGFTSCTVNTDGTLSSCGYAVQANDSESYDFAVIGTAGYLLDEGTSTTDIYACTVNPATGAISNCAISDGGLPAIGGYGLAIQ